MIVKAWNNGSHRSDGNGYGIKIKAQDRDTFFRREWKTIILELEGDPVPVEININKPSFWGATCRELISIRIGRWIIKNGFTPWDNMKPPLLDLEQISDNNFRLIRS